MTALNLDTAEQQRGFDLIPAGTICGVQMTVRMGGAGDGGWLKRTAKGDAEGIDAEFSVLDGLYAKRKVWAFAILNGTTEGHATAGGFTRTWLRAIFESAHDIHPKDESEAARKRRNEMSIEGFNNLRFMARILIEKSKDPAYEDKNKLVAVTPDQKGWSHVEQVPQPTQMGGVASAKPAGATTPAAATASSKPSQAIARPNWATKG
jgi:hypothetical protein